MKLLRALLYLLPCWLPAGRAVCQQAAYVVTLDSTKDSVRWLPRLQKDGADSLRYLGARSWRFVGPLTLANRDTVRAFAKDGARLRLDEIAEIEGLSWGTTAIQSDSVCQVYGLCGYGVVIGIIDTGSGPNSDLPIIGGQNVADFPPSANYSDCNGHGTHTAGTVAGKLTGVAPFASLFIERAASTNGCLLYLSGAFMGLNDACTQKMAVVNISIGYGNTNALDPAVQAAIECGVIVVAAAGNDGSNGAESPASAPGAVAVCAWDGSGRAGFSNYGPRIDLCGPGVNITSTLPNNQYGSMSGTSMASPHIAGVMALLKQVCPSCGRDSLVELACIGALPVSQGGCGVPQLVSVVKALIASGYPTASPVVARPCASDAACVGCTTISGSRPFTASSESWVTLTITGRQLCWSPVNVQNHVGQSPVILLHTGS